MKPVNLPASLIFVLALLLAIVPGCQGSKKAAEDARAVILVGTRTITVGEYKETLDRLLPRPLTEILPEEMDDLKDEVVSQLIEVALLLDEATKLGVVVSDADVEAEVESIREASGEGALEESVVEVYGSMESWREELKKKLIIRKVINIVISPRVDITSQAALSYYRENIKEFYLPEQVHARMIVVGTEEEARDTKNKLTAANFAEVAREVSLSPEGASGGDLGWFGRGDMPQEFEDVVFGLPAGRISDIIKTGYGYHIFFVEAKRGRGRVRYREAKEEIMERLRQESAEREFAAWMSSLKQNARIEIREELL